MMTQNIRNLIRNINTQREIEVEIEVIVIKRVIEEAENVQNVQKKMIDIKKTRNQNQTISKREVDPGLIQKQIKTHLEIIQRGIYLKSSLNNNRNYL